MRFGAVVGFGVLGFCGMVFGAPEFIPIQERAQGYSLSGSALLNDSLHLNPAASSFTNVYSIEGTYFVPRTFSISILDTRTSQVGGALGYFRQTSEDGASLVQGVKLGFFSRVAEWIGVGATGKMVWGTGSGSPEQKVYDADLGVLTQFEFIQLGWTTRNIGRDLPLLGMRREMALGGRISYEQTVFLSVAAVAPTSTMNPDQYGIGFEYVSPYSFALKGGTRYLTQDRDWAWGMGASILSPKVSLHYALEFPNKTVNSYVHTLGISVLM